MATDPCCEGKLHPGKPTGSEETLYDLPTYIANPPDGAQPRALIVILPDAFGWRLPNNRLLADRYSERLPVRTLLPELMDGESQAVRPGARAIPKQRNKIYKRLEDV